MLQELCYIEHIWTISLISVPCVVLDSISKSFSLWLLAVWFDYISSIAEHNTLYVMWIVDIVLHIALQFLECLTFQHVWSYESLHLPEKTQVRSFWRRFLLYSIFALNLSFLFIVSFIYLNEQLLSFLLSTNKFCPSTDLQQRRAGHERGLAVKKQIIIDTWQMKQIIIDKHLYTSIIDTWQRCTYSYCWLLLDN